METLVVEYIFRFEKAAGKKSQGIKPLKHAGQAVFHVILFSYLDAHCSNKLQLDLKNAKEQGAAENYSLLAAT